MPVQYRFFREGKRGLLMAGPAPRAARLGSGVPCREGWGLPR
jgi:hypothetical protein